jgi:hypothetical protein
MNKINGLFGIIFTLIMAASISFANAAKGRYDDDKGYTIEGLGQYTNCNRATDAALELYLDPKEKCQIIRSADSPIRRITAYGEYNAAYEISRVEEFARSDCGKNAIWGKWRHKYSLDGRKTIGCRANENDGVISVYAITLRKMDPNFPPDVIEIVVRLTTNKKWFDQDLQKFEELLHYVKIDQDYVDMRPVKPAPAEK